MNKDTKEEYLEALYKLYTNSESIKTGKIAEALEVSPPTVTEVLPVLEEEGYLKYKPYYGVKLTDKGLEEGRRLVRTHRVLEVFLDKYFSLDKSRIHEKACQMEHIFDMDMINLICKRMGAPEVCPHGKKIPPCDLEECPVGDDEN